jgi:hypothetical protein
MLPEQLMLHFILREGHMAACAIDIITCVHEAVVGIERHGHTVGIGVTELDAPEVRVCGMLRSTSDRISHFSNEYNAISYYCAL